MSRRRTGPLALWLVVLAVLAAPAVIGRAGPGLVSPYTMLLIAIGVCYALAALPLNLLMGYAGQVSLGHAAFLGSGAFVGAIAARDHGLPYPLTLVVAMLVTAGLALVVGLPALRLRGLYLSLVTVAFGLAMLEYVFNNSDLTQGKAGVPTSRPEIGSWFSLHDNHDLLVLLGLMLVGVWVIDRNLTRSKCGRAWNTLRQNEDVAASLGINVAWYKTYAFVVSGAMAGLAGSAYATVVGIAQAESFKFQFSLLLVTIVIVGGLRSRAGVVVTAFLFGFLPRFFLSLDGWDLIVGPALLLVTLARHQGGAAEHARDVAAAVHRRFRRVDRADATSGQLADAPAVLPTFVLPRARLSEQATSREVVLAAESIRVAFGGLVAVDGASVHVRRGAITGIIGPNGAGKTTLFNAIAGTTRVGSGSVVLLGHDVTGLPAHRRAQLGLGRTFQQGGLAKELTVTDNLLVAQHRFLSYSEPAALVRGPGVRRAEAEARACADEALIGLGLQRYAKASLGSLSHGQQRIVELAAMMLLSPSVLLLDEPSAGMSPAAVEALAQRLIDLRERGGQTILLIEHHLRLVNAVCDHVYAMDAGRVLAEGEASAVQADERVVAAFLGAKAGA